MMAQFYSATDSGIFRTINLGSEVELDSVRMSLSRDTRRIEMMRKLRTVRNNDTVAAVVVCIGCAMMGFVLPAYKPLVTDAYPASQAQSDGREIMMPQNLNPDDPIQFDNVLYLKKVRILMGQTISARAMAEKSAGRIADEDWLQDLQFAATNRSDKTITYIQLEIQFPDTQSTGLMMVYSPLFKGVPPERLAVKALQQKAEPLAVAPGQKVTLTLSAEELKPIKQFLGLRGHTLRDIKRVVIQVQYLIFEDGTMWSLGGVRYKPSPKNLADMNE
jgi:hypothetical protein